MNIQFADKRRTLIFLLISNFLLHFGFQIWRTMINNFAVEEIGIGPASIGWLQALREVPGLMGFLLGFMALFISEVRIMSLSVILLGAGIFLTGQANNIPFLFISAVVMSFGFHFFIPCNDGVILMTVEKEQTPKTLGQLRSLGAISALTGTVMVYLLAEGWGYRTLFMVLGGLIALGGVLLLKGPLTGRRAFARKGVGVLPSRTFIEPARLPLRPIRRRRPYRPRQLLKLDVERVIRG